jgi:hypothetical protein
MHLLCLTFRFQLSSEKTIPSADFRVNLESAMRVPKRSQFSICAHKETRSTVIRVNNPYRSPVGIHGMSLIPSVLKLARLPRFTRAYPRRFTFYVARPTRSIPKFREPEKTFLCMDLL